MKISFSAKKIAVLSLFTAFSLITFLIENQFPSLIIPGAKMGLANIFSLAALIVYSPWEAMVVIVIRTVLGALLVGNPASLFYSFTAGVISTAVSALLLYTLYPKISVMAISVFCAALHNAVQNAVFCILSQTALALAYLPYLMLLGLLSGAIVGGATLCIFRCVPLSVWERVSNNKNKLNDNAILQGGKF